jgi:uncharacterized RmlC-like cupin family protein
MTEIRVVRPEDRKIAEGGQTAGMTREDAIVADGRWAGFVRLHAEVPSGWHHHGDNDTYVYLLEGRLRFEFGPGGTQTAEGQKGDFIHIPGHVVHRETPGAEGAEAVVVRAGSGPPLVNVDGPE